MKIISTGSLYGKDQKYLELKGLVKHHNPDILIITGDLFPPIKDSPLLQADYLDNLTEHLKQISKFCGKVFYIFGENDIFAMDIPLQNSLIKEASNVICLNHRNYEYNGYTFIGLPYVKDHDTKLKDWVRTDTEIVNFNDEPAFYTDEDFNLIEITNTYEHILDNPEIADFLRDRISRAQGHPILISHFPPKIDGAYFKDYYNDSINTFLSNFNFVFCGHNMTNTPLEDSFYVVSNGTKIFNHNHLNNMLLYNITVIKNNRLQYFYHPLNRNVEMLLKQSVLYRDV